MLIGIGNYLLSFNASRVLEEVVVEHGRLKAAETPRWLDEHMQYAGEMGLKAKRIVNGFISCEEGLQLYYAIMIATKEEDFDKMVKEARWHLEERIKMREWISSLEKNN